MAFVQDNKKKKITAKPQGVFEALKDIGSPSMPTTASEFTSPSAQSALNQLSNRSPDQKTLFDETVHQSEKEIRQRGRLFFETKRREERLVFSQREEQIAREIVEIQDELKKIADQIVAVSGLSQELKTAVFQPTPEPNIYHLNFFQRIKQLLILARKKIEESNTWLQVYSQRRKRIGFYWTMVGNKGTSFMLSPERYMSTQAG